MKPYEAIGYDLLNASAVSAIVSARVYHGLRPENTDVPAINYYELPGVRFNGLESTIFSINCRAATAGAARDLARVVVDLFAGESGTGTYGTVNGFSIMRSALDRVQGMLPETEEGIFNVPVDVQIVYGVNTVS